MKNILRIFSVGGGQIVEESTFSVPLTEDFESKIRAQIRFGILFRHVKKNNKALRRQRSKLNLEDIIASFKL